MSAITLSAEERQQLLNEASDRYMSGDISVEEFEQVKTRYGSDYRPAIAALAKNLKDNEERKQGSAELSGPGEFVLFFFAILLVLAWLLLHRDEEKSDPNSGNVAA